MGFFDFLKKKKKDEEPAVADEGQAEEAPVAAPIEEPAAPADPAAPAEPNQNPEGGPEAN